MRREHLLVLLVFLILTAIFTFPLVAHLHNGVVGDAGDPLLNTWIITHDIRAVFASPGGFFQGNIMYPARDVITYSEHLLPLAMLAAPIYWLSGNPILAYNFLLFFGFVFSAFGAYLLVRYLTGNRWAGIVGGLFFAFVPYKISQVTHLQICFSAFFPFTLFFLHRYLEEGKTRHLVAFGIFYLVQSLASWHYLLYISMMVAVLVVTHLFLVWERVGWSKLLKLLAVGLISILLVIPFALPYFRTHARFSDFERPLKEASLYSARPSDFLRVLPYNLIYGSGIFTFPRGFPGSERVLFPGVVIIFLALAVIPWKGKRKAGSGDEAVGEEESEEGKEKEEAAPVLESAMRRPVIVGYLIIAIISFILMIGVVTGGIRNYLYDFLYQLGLLRFTRVPARFFVPLSLSLAVLGGFGLEKLVQGVREGKVGRWSYRELMGLTFSLLLLLELLTFNLPVVRVPVEDEVPEVYRWLGHQGDVQVIELPYVRLGPVIVYDRDLAINMQDPEKFVGRECRVIYMSTYHWKQVVNGYSGYFPFSYRRTITEMQGFPSLRSLALLRGLHVDYVIWHWEWLEPDTREAYRQKLYNFPGLSVVEEFGDQTVFSVEDSGTAASPDDLMMELATPLQVPEGREFNLAILASNPSDQPFVCMEEEFQRARVTWISAGGETWTGELEFHSPFFIGPGETYAITLLAGSTPPPGDYQLNLDIGSGVLAGRSFTRRITVVEDMIDSIQPAGIDASLSFLETDKGLVAGQWDGLYFNYLMVKNQGETQWMADTQDERKKGTVRVAIRFEQNNQIVWEEQRCSIPCDVAPGQTIVVPLLFRSPPNPGRYHLFIGMADEGFGWFGQVLETEMVVKGIAP